MTVAQIQHMRTIGDMSKLDFIVGPDAKIFVNRYEVTFLDSEELIKLESRDEEKSELVLWNYGHIIAFGFIEDRSNWI